MKDAFKTPCGAHSLQRTKCQGKQGRDGQDYTARLGQAEVQREKESNNQFPLAKYYFSYLKRKGEQRPPTFPPLPRLWWGLGKERGRQPLGSVKSSICTYCLFQNLPPTWIKHIHLSEPGAQILPTPSGRLPKPLTE